MNWCPPSIRWWIRMQWQWTLPIFLSRSSKIRVDIYVPSSSRSNSQRVTDLVILLGWFHDRWGCPPQRGWHKVIPLSKQPSVVTIPPKSMGNWIWLLALGYENEKRYQWRNWVRTPVSKKPPWSSWRMETYHPVQNTFSGYGPKGVDNIERRWYRTHVRRGWFRYSPNMIFNVMFTK